MHSTNHRDIGTSTATAPAAARRTNPAAIVTMSITATCFSQNVYASVITMYSPTTATVCQRPVNAGETEGDQREDDPGDPGDVDRQRTGRDRSEALRGVEPIGLDVEQVVPEVDAARGEAERDERDEREPEFTTLVEHAGRARRGEDQHVLQPLLRPGLLQQQPQHAGALRLCRPAVIGVRR